MAFTPDRLLNTLQGFAKPVRYCVAFSGGLDSTVLLAALHTLRERLAPAEIIAFHIDHGLQAAAAEWAAQCKDTCQRLDISCRIGVVNAAAKPGESPEAAARRARYALFEQWLEEGDLLLTAHHEDDQAETLLLQLLRGAGVHGLAAMPAYAAFGRGHHARPFLTVARNALETYAAANNLRWIDDPSNTDMRFDRNYLRQSIMPLLQANWPAATATLTRSASLCADAAVLLDELAEADLAEVVAAGKVAALSVRRLRSLPEIRCRNLLRYWIRRQNFPAPGQKHLQSIMRDLLPARADAEPLVCWPGCEVRRFHDELLLLKPPDEARFDRQYAWNPHEVLMIPGLGSLSAISASGAGLSHQRSAGRTIEVGFRHGGERLRPTGHAHQRTLKNLLQEAGIPPWERGRLPLIYIDGELAAVATLWISTEFAAKANEAGWQPVWQPEGA